MFVCLFVICLLVVCTRVLYFRNFSEVVRERMRAESLHGSSGRNNDQTDLLTPADRLRQMARQRKEKKLNTFLSDKIVEDSKRSESSASADPPPPALGSAAGRKQSSGWSIFPDTIRKLTGGGSTNDQHNNPMRADSDSAHRKPQRKKPRKKRGSL